MLMVKTLAKTGMRKSHFCSWMTVTCRANFLFMNCYKTTVRNVCKPCIRLFRQMYVILTCWCSAVEPSGKCRSNSITGNFLLLECFTNNIGNFVLLKKYKWHQSFVYSWLSFSDNHIYRRCLAYFFLTRIYRLFVYS